MPSLIAKINKVKSWVVNAFVEATPISGPAKVKIVSSDNLIPQEEEIIM